ncbi:hypothetical protein ACFVTC_40735 [Streptomyces sp. NPDC057950]|uniref:hypothetical protein n=1 Tax=Streptomyces sp. NPDC057950 TaxID=3346288 RepID=UPI0036EBF05E
MSERRVEAAGNSGEASSKPIPRDLPDQQAGSDEDPWDVVGDPAWAADEQPDPELPDTDEAGTGRRGTPHSGSGHPAQPVPDEPPA